MVRADRPDGHWLDETKPAESTRKDDEWLCRSSAEETKPAESTRKVVVRAAERGLPIMRIMPIARVLLVGAALVHAGPSVVALGQWSRLRVLPGGWCRWRGPAVPRVALTFDDGPDPAATPRVLDRLDALELRATFFVLGSRAQAEPELVMETVDRGHEVALHGFAHDHHLARTPRWVRADLDSGLEALADCGVVPRWYRPPYGQASAATMLSARRRGLEIVHWSAWGREWEAVDAAAVADRIRGALEPGAIVLLHDSDDSSPSGTVDRVVDALGLIADDLVARGLTSSTLSDLVAFPP